MSTLQKITLPLDGGGTGGGGQDVLPSPPPSPVRGEGDDGLFSMIIQISNLKIPYYFYLFGSFVFSKLALVSDFALRISILSLNFPQCLQRLQFLPQLVTDKSGENLSTLGQGLLGEFQPLNLGQFHLGDLLY